MRPTILFSGANISARQQNQIPTRTSGGTFSSLLGRRALVEIGSDFDVMSRIKSWEPDVVIWGYYLDDEISERAEVDRAIRDYAIARKFKTQIDLKPR
jgi:hypothetical protein